MFEYKAKPYLVTKRFDEGHMTIKGKPLDGVMIVSKILKSNCCNDTIIDNTDLCSRCLEHSEIEYNKEVIIRTIKGSIK